jgi:hypothetical protein
MAKFNREILLHFRSNEYLSACELALLWDNMTS